MRLVRYGGVPRAGGGKFLLINPIWSIRLRYLLDVSVISDGKKSSSACSSLHHILVLHVYGKTPLLIYIFQYRKDIKEFFWNFALHQVF